MILLMFFCIFQPLLAVDLYKTLFLSFLMQLLDGVWSSANALYSILWNLFKHTQLNKYDKRCMWWFQSVWVVMATTRLFELRWASSVWLKIFSLQSSSQHIPSIPSESLSQTKTSSNAWIKFYPHAKSDIWKTTQPLLLESETEITIV